MTFWTGILGSIVLLTGAAWPDRKTKTPLLSAKNWLFAIGGLLMLAYAVLGWREGGPVFFVFLELLVAIATVFMMAGTRDTIDAPVIMLSGAGFVAWSLFLFEGYSTVFFILGLSAVGLGYAFENATIKRDAALTAGSALIAFFSYLEASWIFFWLNLFFAFFSGWYLLRALTAKRR